LGVLVGFLVNYLRAKTKDITTQNDNELLNKYIKMLSNTVIDCVVATNQTYVEALKQKGEFDADAQQYAFKMTYDAVIALLSEDAKDYLTNIYGDLSLYITNMIEAEVNRNK
jgi:hypothetical protein